MHSNSEMNEKFGIRVVLLIHGTDLHRGNKSFISAIIRLAVGRDSFHTIDLACVELYTKCALCGGTWRLYTLPHIRSTQNNPETKKNITYVYRN